LLPICQKAILTSPNIHRALPAETLYEHARHLLADITVIPGVAEAVRHAMDNAVGKEAICIAGSLYVVGEAKAYLERRGFPSFERKAGD